MKFPSSLARVLLVAALPILAVNVHGEVYKVVDESGRVTYTDKPPTSQQAEKISLPQTNTQQSIEIPIKPAEDTPPPAAGGGYDKVEILQPRNGASIPPGQLDLIIQVGISPELQPNHRVSILLNGKPLGIPAAATSIRLDNLDRGAHRIEAKVVDPMGRNVASSQAVNIYVHRASKLINPKPSSGK